MTFEDFFLRLRNNVEMGLELIKKKNSDYATSSDPFKNFRAAENIGITVEQGILVRMSDKLARVANLLDREGEVKEESVYDTLVDLINYANILSVYIEGKNDNIDPISLQLKYKEGTLKLQK